VEIGHWLEAIKAGETIVKIDESHSLSPLSHFVAPNSQAVIWVRTPLSAIDFTMFFDGLQRMLATTFPLVQASGLWFREPAST
jgi:hypothetical protein